MKLRCCTARERNMAHRASRGLSGPKPAARRLEVVPSRTCKRGLQLRPMTGRDSTARGVLQTVAVLTDTLSKPASTGSTRFTSEPGTAVSLDNIRQSLIRQEDTIIFSLIERAQFAQNSPLYQPSAVSGREVMHSYSLLEHMLRATEQVHGAAGRFSSPDEQAFYPEDLPALILPPISYPEVLARCARSININDEIMDMYLQHLLPGIAAPGDDRNYGSAAMQDIVALQALSKRIHYGKFVAEAKFQEERLKYMQLISARDAGAIWDSLTYRAVEVKVVERVRQKAEVYGQDVGSKHTNYKVAPERVARLYEEWVMPLTKKVQVAYLLRRLDR